MTINGKKKRLIALSFRFSPVASKKHIVVACMLRTGNEDGELLQPPSMSYNGAIAF